MILAAAYLLVGRGSLPPFLPHVLGTADREDAIDVPMAFISFGCAVVAVSASQYARAHRSWMRTRAWHRKHGRI